MTSTQDKRMVVVIMAGGSGTRFWPLSRRHRPKQLLNFFGDQPMIAETVARFEGLVEPRDILIVTNDALAEAVADAVPSVPKENILREPIGRNTAPCVGMAAIEIARRLNAEGHANEDIVMAVFPSDHYIRDAAGFRDVVRAAAAEAGTGPIVTLGIEPTHPETGYGYIHRGASADGSTGPGAKGIAVVEEFVEKPDRNTAIAYLRDGNYLWNAGMFFFRVDTILGEFKRQLPELSAQLSAMTDVLGAGDDEALAAIFTEIKPVSIDYGVMENAESVKVLPVSFGWSDVGHWDALPDVSITDDDGNVLMGDVIALDCKNSVLVGHDRRVLAAVGLDRIVVVDSEDALLVAPRDRVQEVRRVVDALKQRDSSIV